MRPQRNALDAHLACSFSPSVSSVCQDGRCACSADGRLVTITSSGCPGFACMADGRNINIISNKPLPFHDRYISPMQDRAQRSHVRSVHLVTAQIHSAPVRGHPRPQPTRGRPHAVTCAPPHHGRNPWPCKVAIPCNVGPAPWRKSTSGSKPRVCRSMSDPWIVPLTGPLPHDTCTGSRSCTCVTCESKTGRG